MGRAARRAQERAERRQRTQQRQAPAAVRTSAPAAVEDVRQRGSFFKPRWALDVISELRKVTWPSRQEVGHLTAVVIVVSVLVGAMLGVADLGFNWFVENTILR
jgi:preprotein translocase SecE subunit